MPHRQGHPVPIHRCHNTVELRAMVGPCLQDIVLELMNHFMRERSDDLSETLAAEQWQGESDNALFLV